MHRKAVRLVRQNRRRLRLNEGVLVALRAKRLQRGTELYRQHLAVEIRQRCLHIAAIDYEMVFYKGEKMKLGWFFLAAMTFSATSFANSACDKPRNDFDGLYCLNKVYQEADAELNANYKKLIGKLDAAGAAALKKGQLAWLNMRNSSCSRREGDGFFVNLDCATGQTINRAQFLQDRYRECVSSGCQNSKL